MMLTITETNASYERIEVKNSFGNHLYISMFFFFFFSVSLFYPFFPPCHFITSVGAHCIISGWFDRYKGYFRL